MSFFGDIDTDNSIKQEENRLGGNFILESDIYEATVEAAFVHVAGSGAKGVTVHLVTADGRRVRSA